uniref:Uncharacterized protein n=1 Tax=Arion vulgaris TaxID=1028688 RepID=A0A0B7B649_9EUPU
MLWRKRHDLKISKEKRYILRNNIQQDSILIEGIGVEDIGEFVYLESKIRRYR